MKDLAIISISGRICSGKSFAAKVISKEYQIPIASFGEFLRVHCMNRFGTDDRVILQNEGVRLIDADPKWLLMNTINHFHIDREWMVLEGVRHLSILKLIQANFPRSISIFVDAKEETRLARFIARKENGDLDSLKEAFYLADKHPVELETDSLGPLCTYRVNSEIKAGPDSLNYLVQSLELDFKKQN